MTVMSVCSLTLKGPGLRLKARPKRRNSRLGRNLAQPHFIVPLARAGTSAPVRLSGDGRETHVSCDRTDFGIRRVVDDLLDDAELPFGIVLGGGLVDALGHVLREVRVPAVLAADLAQRLVGLELILGAYCRGGGLGGRLDLLVDAIATVVGVAGPTGAGLGQSQSFHERRHGCIECPGTMRDEVEQKLEGRRTGVLCKRRSGHPTLAVPMVAVAQDAGRCTFGDPMFAAVAKPHPKLRGGWLSPRYVDQTILLRWRQSTFRFRTDFQVTCAGLSVRGPCRRQSRLELIRADTGLLPSILR